jgi:hypothetical protein
MFLDLNLVAVIKYREVSIIDIIASRIFRVYRCRYFLYRNIKGNNMQSQINRKHLFSIGFLSILSTILFTAFTTISSAFAHHSLVGEFDTSVNFELRGSITDLEWTNPHIWFYMDVTAENGDVAAWQCEMGSPNQLIRLGWRKEDLPNGTVIVAQANPARDGSNTCSTRVITLDDGTPVFSRAGNR